MPGVPRLHGEAPGHSGRNRDSSGVLVAKKSRVRIPPGRSSSRPRREPRRGKQRGCSQPAGPRPESNRLATRSVRERGAPLLRAVSTEEQQEGKRAPAPYGPAAQQAPDLGGSQLILSDLDDMPSALGTADPTLTTPCLPKMKLVPRAQTAGCGRQRSPPPNASWGPTVRAGSTLTQGACRRPRTTPPREGTQRGRRRTTCCAGGRDRALRGRPGE